MRRIALLILICAVSAPAAAYADPASPASADPAADSLITTKWELKKPAARPRIVQRRSIGSGQRRVTTVTQPRVRIIGGATASSAQGRNGQKAKVGIALPF
jgi:hypothetical protein